MTKDDFKTEMQKTGISPAVTEKLSEIIESSDTPCEAMKRVHAFCPQFEIGELQKQFDLVSQQAGFSGCEFSEVILEAFSNRRLASPCSSISVNQFVPDALCGLLKRSTYSPKFGLETSTVV